MTNGTNATRNGTNGTNSTGNEEEDVAPVCKTWKKVVGKWVCRTYVTAEEARELGIVDRLLRSVVASTVADGKPGVEGVPEKPSSP